MTPVIRLADIEQKRQAPTHTWTKKDCGHRVHHRIADAPPKCRTCETPGA